MSATTLPYQASNRTLLRASLAALVAGAAILTLFVLPAEYGVDATGLGRALGLTALNGNAEDADDATDTAAPAAPAVAIAVPPQTQANIAQTTPFRTDTRTLTLPAHSDAELKAEMLQGDHFVFTWKASGPVKMDMHGEKSITSEEATTYWKQKALTTAQGQLTAPFTGIHGWYWRNQGEAPVTLTVTTTGFYKRVFEPKPE